MKKVILVFVASVVLFSCNFNSSEVKDSNSVTTVYKPVPSQSEITKDGERMGTWFIESKQIYETYVYAIYLHEGMFYGFNTEDGSKVEMLRKEDEKYFVEGSDYGDYYEINGDKEMTLFDQEGDLTEVGVVAVFKE